MATDFSIPELPPPLQVVLGQYKQKLFLLSYLRIRLINFHGGLVGYILEGSNPLFGYSAQL